MASAWGGSWGDAWGDSWGSVEDQLKSRVIRRGKFKVWDKDPWDLPEKEIVEATAAQIESLLDQKDFLKTELQEAKGAQLRQERASLNKQLSDINKQIDRAKKQLAQQRAEYEKAEIEAKRRDEDYRALLAAQEEEDIRAIVTIIMDLYDD